LWSRLGYLQRAQWVRVGLGDQDLELTFGRRFEPTRSNPWHHAPGRYAVFTLSGAVDIEIGDGTVRRLGPGDILIAEDLTGQGHATREVGPEPRVSIFVPLQ